MDANAPPSETSAVDVKIHLEALEALIDQRRNTTAASSDVSMKFSVKCLVSSVNAGELAESESVDKEITMANPDATLLNLRAAASVQFRLQVHGFRIIYKGSRDTVDLSDEKKTLAAAGLQDGDSLVLVSKRARDASTDAAPPSTTAADLLSLAATGGDAGADDEEESFHASDEDEEDDGGDMIEEDGGDLLEPVGNGELYGRILEVTPNLISMREEFLQNPRGLMERIQREDPSLFQLITAHQEDFVALVNDEVLVRTLQQEKEAQQAFLDEELDEEQEEALLNMLVQQMETEDAEGYGENDVETEGEDAEDGDVASEMAAPSSNAERILAFVPNQQDEATIQTLTQLGFSYEQCKLAFYMCHRSVERAANMLFESPPSV